MSEFRDQLMGMRARRRKYGIRRFTLVVVPILAILFQVYAPQFITYLSFLEWINITGLRTLDNAACISRSSNFNSTTERIGLYGYET